MNAALRPMPDLSSVRFWHILLVAGAISPLVAFASLPAQDEDILCASTDVVVGTVVKATRSDLPRIDAFCGYKPWDCSSGYTSSCQDNPHDITLRIRVSTVLGSKANQTFDPSPFYTRAEQAKVSVGDTVEVTTELFNNVCQRGIEDHQGWFSVNPPAKGTSPAESVSPEVLRKFYMGKEFVFSLRALRFIGLASNAPGIYADHPDTFSSDIWRMGRLAWVKATLRQ
jgi:hypothetical protein